MHQPAIVNGSLGLRPPRVLLVGDSEGQVAASLSAVAPELGTTSVGTVFDALAELQVAEYGAVLVGIEPMEHRPEAAVRSLRAQLRANLGRRPPRLVLFGSAAFEPLARQTIAYGVDDYVLLPVQPEEMRKVLRPTGPESEPSEESRSLPLVPADVPLAAIILDALTAQPGAALPATILKINTYLPTAVRIERVEQKPEASTVVAAQMQGGDNGWLLLHVAPAADEADRDLAQHDLQQLALELSKLAELDARHLQLQRLALTDDLTACYNRRYFRHFLEKILAKARAERFAVTLLLFDIDDFKRYNDRHGHGVGDAILKQTAELIKRCVRDHDLVARIGGDEFAVVFWEKEGPRVPHDPSATPGGRFPNGPLEIAARFRRLLSEPDFFALGASGKGTLSISGGMAVYPFDAQSPDQLIEAADRALIFGSKRSGKNSISLVGSDPATGNHTSLDSQSPAAPKSQGAKAGEKPGAIRR